MANSIETIISNVRSRTSGRTRYLDLEPAEDLALVGEIGRLREENAALHAEIERLRKERDEARAQALEEAADTAFVSARMGMTSEQIHAEICALKEKQG